MSFSKIFQILSSLVQPFYSSFRSVSTIHGGVSHRHSQHLKIEEEFLLNLAPFSSRFMVLPSCHPLIIVFDCHNSFLTIRSISWVVSISFLRRPSCHNSLSSHFSSRYPNLTGALLKYSLISSWSLCSLVSNSLKYLHSFSNSSRCFFIFSSFIFNSYGGSFKIPLPLLSYQFIHC